MDSIGRRAFLNKMIKGLGAVPLAGMLPAAALQASTGGDATPPLHYRPLNGTRLRDIARRKLHHGHGRFSNPLGIPRDELGDVAPFLAAAGGAPAAPAIGKCLLVGVPDGDGRANHQISITSLPKCAAARMAR